MNMISRQMGIRPLISRLIAGAGATVMLAAVQLGNPAQAAMAHAGGRAANAGARLMSINVGMAFITLIIFVVLLLVLSRFAWRPLIEGLSRRENAIRESVQAAAAAQAQVEQTRKLLEEKIAEVQRQASQQLQQAKMDASKAAEAIHQRAEAEARAMKDQALRDIEAAKLQALGELARRSADLSVELASRIIEREINAADQRKFLDESLAQLTASVN
ncbi:MAG: F0F1 ATP synthase subunit B [Phycisphaerae bacterium]|nr:F0F1 ATP synthase subunit B [Phycisphaerae bacterium]